ncbi:MAG TPA: BamA/TamA family outer membrane protein [Cyclobacteriaceae bacterium]|nr:BamA/TamA family outer membrane protein [Cyclobacteriaceae bacterium]
MTAKKYKYFVLIILASLILGGCSGTKYLQPGEKLLTQKIEAPSNINKEELRDLYVQRSNRKLFGIIPYFWFYYTGKKWYDPEKFIRKRAAVEQKFDRKIAALPEESTRKINNLEFKKQRKLTKIDTKIRDGNTVMQWGEPLSILDTTNVRLTAERFSTYLSSKGYFRNNVKTKIDSDATKATVTYQLNPGKAYFIDTIFYNINDSAVRNILIEDMPASLIKQGERYDQDNFTNERERLDLLLKDLGYFEFSRQYVEFEVDTAYSEDKLVAVKLVIRDPVYRQQHKKFVITDVNFVTDAAAGSSYPDQTRTTRRVRDIRYSYYEDKYNLRLLSQRVFLRQGDLYSRTSTFSTQRQLANLDAFKFVNVNYDTTGGQFIANIYTSATDRYQWSNEAGVNVTQGFPGPFFNTSLKKRNVFGGFETLDLSGRFGFEGVASATSDQNIYKSTEAGINFTMTFPQLIFPLSDRMQYMLGRYNPKTKLLIGYSYTDRPEYRRTFATFSGTYSMENARTTQYSFTFANINIIDTLNTSPAFRDFLSQQDSVGNFSLVNSFYPSFVTSMIFGITWNHNNYGQADRNSVFIRAQVESGGTIWNFIDPAFITEHELQYYKYLRFGLDVRRNKVLDRNTVVAFRLNTGVAYAYGENNTVPYEKFFFAGGSSSVRAWRPRRLGPGSFKPNLSSDAEANGLFDYSLEKPADILIEASVELRKKLFGFVNGAVFLDAGNVWTFHPWTKRVNEETVPNGNSEFKWNQFYKEFGIGTGFGFRFDFTFLILRFDVGIKVYDPARDEGDRFVLNRAKFFRPFGAGKEPVIYNVGIGFPF